MCSITSCIHTSHTIFADVVCIKLAFFPPVWAPQHSSQRLSNSLGFLPCSDAPGTVFSGIENFCAIYGLIQHYTLTYTYSLSCVQHIKSKWKLQEASCNSTKRFCSVVRFLQHSLWVSRKSWLPEPCLCIPWNYSASLPLCKSHSLQDTTLWNLWQCGDCLQLRH